MILRFVEGGGIDSRVIRYTTRCRWSHVEAMGGNTDNPPNMTYGAMLKGGVKWRFVTDPVYHHAVAVETVNIAASSDQEAAFWAFLAEQEYKPYDVRAIVGFGLGERDWREEDSWFCSELQVRALEVAGLVKLPDDIPVWRITPRDVWLLLAGRSVSQ
jgi:hypothetical protein